MTNYRTLGTDFSEGLRAPHYTNGRLLTAEDLQQDQRTQLERLAQTGRAAGYGIVEGFQVTAVANKTALSITSGLGLNRHGDVVHLAADKVTLPVQPVSDDTEAVRRSGRFEICLPQDGDQPATTAGGAYLLTVSPLAQLEGSVPRKACDGTGTSTCANQWEVEGVEFKIIRLVNYTAPTGNRADRNRNLLAHWFYGSDELVTLMRDPLQFDGNYTGYGQIAAEDFNQCDLPLAVFYWANNMITFVDQWAVRRRLVHPYPADKWAANIRDRRAAEGQSRFLQFQEHIADLQAQFGNNTDNIRAVDRFAYLPPVGILPVNPFELVITDVFEAALTKSHQALIRELNLTVVQVLERVRTAVLGSLGTKTAFNLERFFGEMLPPDYKIVHEDFVHDRLHQSWVQPPIHLPAPTTEAGLFDLLQLDGSLVAVNDNNFAAILNTLNERFSGPVFSFAAQRTALGGVPAAAAAIETIEAAAVSATLAGDTGAGTPTSPGSAALSGTAPTIVTGTTAAAGITPAVNNAAAALAGAAATPDTPGAAALRAGLLGRRNLTFDMLATNPRFRPPREVFEPPRGDDGEVEPLVDIMVVDELLDPYRDRLAREMSGRIDDAITSLSGTGGIFTAINHFASVNNSIANAFTLNNFLRRGANRGTVDIGRLFSLINKGTPPIFYVVFARRRPPVITRPLRL